MNLMSSGAPPMPICRPWFTASRLKVSPELVFTDWSHPVCSPADHWRTTCRKKDGASPGAHRGRERLIPVGGCLRRSPPRGCRLSEAATSLNSLGVLALPYVGERNDQQDALGAGLGVTEFAQEGSLGGSSLAVALGLE